VFGVAPAVFFGCRFSAVHVRRRSDVTAQVEKSEVRESSRAAALLERIRGGDREALAEAIEENRMLIQRYIRMRLRGSLRKLFDTGDVLGTVSRRLDHALLRGTLELRSTEHLRALLQRTIQNAMIDKHRLLTRLDSVEGPDSEWASGFVRRSRRSTGGLAGVDEPLEAAMAALDDEHDRRILAMWMHGLSHGEIADRLGFTPAGVRQRWHRIRFRLKEAFSEV
jgi:RNA polymerase sigma factor (sigma-70 family)